MTPDITKPPTHSHIKLDTVDFGQSLLQAAQGWYLNLKREARRALDPVHVSKI